MKQKITPAFRVKAIVVIGSLLIVAVYFGLIILLRKLTGWPVELLFLGLSPITVIGGIILLKAMQKSRFKDDLDKFEQEYKEKQEKSMGKDEKPRLWGIALVTLITFIWTIIYGYDMVAQMEEGESLRQYLPEAASFATFFICTLLLAIIAFNIWKGRVFTHMNVNLIYSISSVITLSALLQGSYLGETPMVPNTTVMMFYFFISMIIFFLAEILEVAIKIRKDQDLIV